MTTELHGLYFKPGLVNAKVGAKTTKAYSSSVITSNIIGCYDNQGHTVVLFTRIVIGAKLTPADDSVTVGNY